MLAKVTSKGQVTIPNEIRKKLGIGKDDQVDFVIVDDRVILTPVKTLRDLRGAVKAQKKAGFAEEREKAKDSVAKRVQEEMQ